MRSVVALDPGPTQTALVSLWDGRLIDRSIWPNEQVLNYIKTCAADAFVCEMVQSFGMGVGREVFETVLWIGRYMQVCEGRRFDLVYRGEVKMHLCHSMRAKDSNIRCALLDRFGGRDATRKGNVLHGFKRDLWAALGVLVTWCDRNAVQVHAA